MIQSIVKVQKADVESLFNLALKIVAAEEKLTQLTLAATRSMLVQAEKDTLKALRSNEPGQPISSQAGPGESMPDTMDSFARQLLDIAASIQAEFNCCNQPQNDACAERVHTLIDQVAKTAPAGSESIVSMERSAIGTARSLGEAM